MQILKKCRNLKSTSKCQDETLWSEEKRGSQNTGCNLDALPLDGAHMLCLLGKYNAQEF